MAKKRKLSRREQSEKLRGRLKDTLWSLRQQNLGTTMVGDVDRILPFLTFNRTLSKESLENLFVDYPKRVSQDIYAVLCIQIQKVVRKYWEFAQNNMGLFQGVMLSILALENIARQRLESYQLQADEVLGYKLVRRR